MVIRKGHTMTDIDYIKNNLVYRDKLLQIIEECSECAAAAAKVLRIERKTNPTPVKPDEAWKHVMEEVADVLNAIEVFLRQDDRNAVDIIRAEKLERWRTRLEERYAKK